MFTLLFTRYFHFADVRYYTLSTVKTIAARQAARRGAGAAGQAIEAGPSQGAETANGDAGGRKAKKAKGPQGAAVTAQGEAVTGHAGEVTGAALVPQEDVCRNLFDILAALPDSLSNGASSGAGGEGDDGNNENGGEVRSWCGGVEVGVVAGAADKNESARARRKRKAAEQTTGGQEPQPGEHSPVG